MPKILQQVTIVDPPSGWMYGFPKPYTCVHSGDESLRGEETIAWFLANGYPEKELKDGMLRWCKSWVEEVEVDMPDKDVDG